MDAGKLHFESVLLPSRGFDDHRGVFSLKFRSESEEGSFEIFLVALEVLKCAGLFLQRLIELVELLNFRLR
jgi:hypothetical protein